MKILCLPQTITTPAMKESCNYTLDYTNQGSAVSSCTFHIDVVAALPYVATKKSTTSSTECLVNAGESVTLGLNLSTIVSADEVVWSTGEKGDKITINDLQTSGTYTATFPFEGETVNIIFNVLVKSNTLATLPTGYYLISHVETGRLLTGHGLDELVTFEEGDSQQPSAMQTWYITNANNRHGFIAVPDSFSLSINGKLGSNNMTIFYICKRNLSLFSVNYFTIL